MEPSKMSKPGQHTGVQRTESQRKLMSTDTQNFSVGSTVSFHNISYKVKRKSGLLFRRKIVMRQILDNVNGIMRPGLNAILGPTGCGKSSLLDILAARKDPHGLSGDVLIDGAPQPPNFACISGYVVQDDIVLGTLTVRENLQFSAALRLPTSVTRKEKNERINQVIMELGLTKVADSKVGTPFLRGVSGGERKRCNIGMEIISDPSILFLDEPTTGLDASTAGAVLLMLKRMARQGKNIIFSIHQPRYSIFRLFDSLTLLAAGRMLYHGPAENTLKYFTSLGYVCEPHNNPADFFLDVINGDSTAVTENVDPGTSHDGKKHPDTFAGPPTIEEHVGGNVTVVEKLATHYTQTPQYQETRRELDRLSSENKKVNVIFVYKKAKYKTNFCHQLRWVFDRSFKNMIRNPQVSLAQIFATIVLSLVIGAIYFGVKNDRFGIQNRVGAFFFITINQSFGGMSAVELFIEERKLFMHEYVGGYYRVATYFVAKLLSDFIPMRSIPGIIFTCITYFMIGFQRKVDTFFIMMLTLVQISLTSTAVSLAIAAGQGDVTVSSILTTICFILMIIFSGLLVNLTSTLPWLTWLKYFSLHRYGLNALQVNEFMGLEFCGNITQRTLKSCSRKSPFILCTGEEYLNEQGIDATTWELWSNHIALACMTVICLFIAYLKLCFMKKLS